MATLSYPKSVRLHQRKAFELLLATAATYYNSCFKVFFLVHDESAAGEPSGISRFAVSVPKKSFKRAVKRNLLKRRIREAIRLNRGRLPDGFAADFLFFYRTHDVNDFAVIEQCVVDAFDAVVERSVRKDVAENPQTEPGDE